MNNQNELTHHGIKGMHWGVRRYQNADGSYTLAGRKRYGINLDVNDTSRRNIAKIRKGEAYRRLDTAKRNNPDNYTRIAELQSRVRSAKSTERKMRAYDRGAKLAAKGQTITGNRIKSYAAIGASRYAAQGLTYVLNKSINNLREQGRLTPGHIAVANQINKIGGVSMQLLGVAYATKKLYFDNANLRAYQTTTWSGDHSIKRVGSLEYADVKKRNKKD